MASVASNRHPRSVFAALRQNRSCRLRLTRDTMKLARPRSDSILLSHSLKEVGLDDTLSKEKTMTAIELAHGCIAAGYTIGAIGYLILMTTHG